ncbi:type IV pilin protein [Piscinibacter terrae]|nr:type IV pilin protein [Albitalea terrae]
MNARSNAGFTLIETMCTVAIAGILSSVAYPGFTKLLNKARRADAKVALMNMHLAQERYRSDHLNYASMSDLGIAASSPAKHYTLSVESTTDTGFKAQAVAAGPQASDANCRHLQVSVDGLAVTYQSGSDATVSNSAEVNKQCWGL